MKAVDPLARRFVRQHGDRLRTRSYDQLYTGNQSQEGERSDLPAPPELNPYRFSVRRARYGAGIIRVYVEGERRGRVGTIVRVADVFDMHPDGRVTEIPSDDEDWCGRS